MAKLMRDIGSDVGMNYGCDLSGAKTFSLKNTFKRLGYRTIVTSGDSESALRSWLDQRVPVIMRGNNKRVKKKFLGITYKTSYEEGHAWVCDGYLTRRYTQKDSRTGRVLKTYDKHFYHQNWGWGSNYDRWWYSYGNLAPQTDAGAKLGMNFHFNRELLIAKP